MSDKSYTPGISDVQSVLSIYQSYIKNKDMKSNLEEGKASEQEYLINSTLEHSNMVSNIGAVATSAGILAASSTLAPTAGVAATAFLIGSITVKSGLAILKNKHVIQTHKTKRPVEEEILKENNKLFEALTTIEEKKILQSQRDLFNHSMDLSTSLQLAYTYNEIFFNINKRNQYAPKLQIFEKCVDHCKEIISKANEVASNELNETLNGEERSFMRKLLAKPLNLILTEKFKASLSDHKTKKELFDHIQSVHNNGNKIINDHYSVGGGDPYEGYQMLKSDIDETIGLTYTAVLAASVKNQFAYTLGKLVRDQLKFKDMPLPEYHKEKSKKILSNIASLHKRTGEGHYEIISKMAQQALDKLNNGEPIPIPKKWNRKNAELTEENMKSILKLIDIKYTMQRETPPSSDIDYRTNFKKTLNAVILNRKEIGESKSQVKRKSINPDHMLKLEEEKKKLRDEALSSSPKIHSVSYTDSLKRNTK